ncbi:MAG: hypothetical protein Q8R76_05655 [Candidatus Omnitrophota bacterium]|nr:hypothetical protein [Candidatus Omnitrophota bacterium]
MGKPVDIKIALISSNTSFNEDLKKALDQESRAKKDETFHVKEFHSVPTMEEAVIHYSPHMVIVNIETDMRSDKLFFLDQLSRIAGRIPVVASAAEMDSDLILSCLKKGTRDFIKQPIDSIEVRQIINRLLTDLPQLEEDRQLADTFSFFSYKGGIGTTFLAANTAVALAQMTGAKVLLWDLVMQNGDVPFFFDYEPSATMIDLLENIGAIDGHYLKGTLPTHSTGVTILAGPKRPEEAETVRNDQIQNLHETLREYYDYIIVDSGHTLTDPVISVMDYAKNILLITDLHLPVLKNTLRCLDVFERLGYVEGKFKLLLNRYNSKYEKFDLSKASEILRYPIAFSVMNDYVTASRSLNAGIPIADLDRECGLAKQFTQLAQLLVREFMPLEEKPANWMERLKLMLPNFESLVSARKGPPSKGETVKGSAEEKEQSHAA